MSYNACPLISYGDFITPANVLALAHAYATSASRSLGFGDKNLCLRLYQ